MVLEDRERDQSASSEVNFDRLLEKVRLASSVKLFDMAYVYLTAILVRTAYGIARKYGVKAHYEVDRALLEDLGFKGILPQDVVEASLAALSVRNSVAHTSGEMASVSEQDVEALVSRHYS